MKKIPVHFLKKQIKTDSSRKPNADDEINIVKTVPAAPLRRTERKINLSGEEIKVIESNRMLTDESINIAQIFLKKQFPHISGFHHTVLGRASQFEIIKKKESYIQILHLQDRCHWVCLGNIDEQKNDNRVYYLFDNLSKKHLNYDLIKQVALYSFCKDDDILIHKVFVQ